MLNKSTLNAIFKGVIVKFYIRNTLHHIIISFSTQSLHNIHRFFFNDLYPPCVFFRASFVLHIYCALHCVAFKCACFIKSEINKTSLFIK